MKFITQVNGISYAEMNEAVLDFHTAKGWEILLENTNTKNKSSKEQKEAFDAWVQKNFKKESENYFAAIQEALSRAKAAKLSILNNKFDAIVQENLGEVIPSAEMLTWETQEAESLRYLASEPKDSALCPTMAMIAEKRGVELTLLCQKSVQKAELYRRLISTLIGQRQKYQDLIEASTSVAELDSIVFWQVSDSNAVDSAESTQG